ncbi:hypothetical protein D910_04700 [Dendroctonus ponderosae]|uniref:Protein quiver n=1 Tax=Dendroctonus ponderosae TaxID=77166 RepID=U4UBG9_DENPD|nr:hypothetical protein D910_04700 [Dendroctonus ponderosae]
MVPNQLIPALLVLVLVLASVAEAQLRCYQCNSYRDGARGSLCHNPMAPNVSTVVCSSDEVCSTVSYITGETNPGYFQGVRSKIKLLSQHRKRTSGIISRPEQVLLFNMLIKLLQFRRKSGDFNGACHRLPVNVQGDLNKGKYMI